ncbi:hypothetical protein NIES3275_60230 [Microchaete diplosiphon NIES-3275]|nr:hypothetical protein NIES3275_60230 [Microchaete diplosiphon NIES-3275]
MMGHTPQSIVYNIIYSQLVVRKVVISKFDLVVYAYQTLRYRKICAGCLGMIKNSVIKVTIYSEFGH